MSGIERWRLMVGPEGDTWTLDDSDDLSDVADGYRVVEAVAAEITDEMVDRGVVALLAERPPTASDHAEPILRAIHEVRAVLTAALASRETDQPKETT